MRKLIMSLCLSFMFCTPAWSIDCNTVNNIMDSAARDWVAASDQIFVDYVRLPDDDFFDECLGSISGIGGGIDLHLPSIRDIINNAACSMVRSYIENHIGALSNNYNYSISALGGVVSADASAQTQSSGYSDVRFQVNDTSSDAAQVIWDAIQ